VKRKKAAMHMIFWDRALDCSTLLVDLALSFAFPFSCRHSK
jgi:hypothetical protein